MDSSLTAPAPTSKLENRIAIVTGGGRGLGRVMAEAMIAEGARVVITASRNKEELLHTVEDINRGLPGSCRGVVADVSDWRSCSDVVRETVETFGGVDILVNNAGRGVYELAPPGVGRNIDFWEVDPDKLLSLLNVNLAGPFFMARACVPHMLEAGYGRIINISTSRSTMVLKGMGAYGAAKAGLEVFTRLWADELQGSGVTVNVLAPGGATDTAILPGNVGNRANPDFQAGKEPPGGEGRSGVFLPPAIMGPPAVWLASPESAATTGRRFIARDWPTDCSPADAAVRAASPPVSVPSII